MERQTDNRQTAIAEVDARLVKSILDGNRVGFRMLINRHATTVRMFVARFIPLLEDEEEVTQDVFMKAYESLQRFDGDKANFKTWLLRIAYHAVLKHLRHEPRLEFVELEGLDIETISDDATNALLGDTASHRLTLLKKAVSQLAPDDQMLISLYYYDGRPLSEIAYIVDRSNSYLSSRLQWLRKKIYQTVIQLERNEKD